MTAHCRKRVTRKAKAAFAANHATQVYSIYLELLHAAPISTAGITNAEAQGPCWIGRGVLRTVSVTNLRRQPESNGV